MAHLLKILFFVTILPPLTIAQDSTCDERSLVANVVDANHHQIVGLTKDQFRASLRGQPVTVAQAAFETGSERILILVDTSGSMLGDPDQWKLVKMIAGAMVLDGPSPARFSLVTFSSTIETKVGFDQTRETVWKAILDLNPKPKVGQSRPGTALNDAILKGAGLFGSPQPGDTIYIITDGIDNKSHNSISKALEYLEQRNIRLFASVIQNRYALPRIDGYVLKEPADVIGEVASQTGGSHVVFETGDPVKAFDKSKDALRRQYNEIAPFYVLGIKLSGQPDKPVELKITLTDINGDPRKGAVVLHPRKLFPCTVQLGAR